jgi:TonB family protein
VPFLTANCLIVLTLLTTTQVLPPNPALANPVDHATPQSSDSTGNTKKAIVGAAIEIRTDTEGVDFAPFMRSVYRSVKREWLAGMPPSVEKGDKGVVTIQFRVQQDGNVSDDSLKVVSSSSKKEYDDASLRAIRNVAPFDHLPSKFSQPFVELRMIFYYNIAPPKKQ